MKNLHALGLAVTALALGCPAPTSPPAEPAAAPSEAPASAPASRPAADGAGPQPARHALGPEGEIRTHADDRCPVCAMRPHAHPDRATAIALTDGRTYHFCGAGCLVRAYLDPAKHLGTSSAAIDRAVVRDYFTGEALDARRARWIAGSDVVGAMGPALVPLGGEAAVKKFIGRHGGGPAVALDAPDAPSKLLGSEAP